MKASILCVHALLAMAAICQTTWAQAGRIPQISTKIGGRPAVVPQSYFDAVATEAADSNMHPSLGPYTVTAVKSGNWSDPTLWSTGALPGANATVDLGAHYVTYDVASTVKIKHIHNSGAGIFERAPGSVLWVSTQMFHGIYLEGEADAPIPSTNPTRTIYWYSDAPGQTVKYGLVCMGPARLRGETKKHFLNAASNLTTGATTIQLIGVAGSNWKVGDEICITATEASGTATTDPTYTGPTAFDGSWNGADSVQTQTQGFKTSQDEPRTITAISGDIITLSAPLAYNHMVYSTTLPRGQSVTVRPYVVNFTRSIQHRAEVASTDLQRRPHIMFMHNDDVDVRYVDVLNFGRTSTDPSLYVPVASGGKEVFLGSTNLANTNNVRGRYGLHIHGTGSFFGRKMVVIQGIVVRGENGPSMTAIPVPGWGITQHNSRAAIEDSITYNVRGAGFVSELGNEIGQWVNNISIWNRGDGFKTSWSSRQESHINHNGHIGTAFENQARGILQHNNVAVSSHFGWMYHQQTTNALQRVTDKFSLRYKDPMTEGGKNGIISGSYGLDNDTYGIEQEQIPDFNDNTCFNVGTGFFVAHRQFTDRCDQSAMIAKRFHCIGTTNPMNLHNYTFYYSFYDSYWRGSGTGSAASLGGNTFGMNWVNMKVENYSNGFLDNGLGYNYNGFWVDIAFTNVTTPFNNNKTYPTSTTDTPSDHYFWNVMGPWTITDANVPNPGFTAKPRIWSSITTASLPSVYPSAPRGLGGVKPPGAATPSFTLAAGSDVTTGPTGHNTISLSGTIVDHVGVRKWPDGYVTFADLVNVGSLGPHKNQHTTGTEMVETNGCFNDNGTWKCRLWFNLDERRDGNYLQFPIDITLTGFDPIFLADNTVDPNATKPALPLALESIEEPSTLPAAPSNVTPTWATMLNGWLKLTWTDNSANETGFTIQSYNGSTWSTYGTVAANVTTYTRTGLTMPSGPYTLRVIATGSAGNSVPSSQVTLSIPAPPAGPAGLTATPGTGQVVLSWNAVAGASNYNISRATASAGPYSVVKYNNAGTTYTNTGLTAGTTYYYKVCYNVTNTGSSSYSAAVSATPN
ncbi:MAG: hypothetical protein K0R17_1704 [Rariglobus sp.]|jgi:hypothetical protein|nr:hypothetical protein [Rariglobus sp.]